MANFNDLFTDTPLAGVPASPIDDQELEITGEYDDQELLDLWKQVRLESFSDRWVFERQWMRNIYYVLGRQWIEYFSAYGGWRDKRMARWIPRPVTNKCKETVQALRAMFTAIKFGVNVRPNGTSPEAVSTAATCDELAPVLHDAHNMNGVQSEFDFWLCTLGNAFFHTFVDYDLKYGAILDFVEQCVACGQESKSSELAKTKGICPDCQGTQFENVIDPKTGAPLQKRSPKGQPVTIPLSPLELAFPNDYARFDDLPYVVRMRWRTKTYFKNHPTLKDLVEKIVWQKAPSDRSLQIFKSLSMYNDLGVTPVYITDTMGGDNSQDGITEFETWMKPCDKYPDGLVFRVYGDANPVVAHLEDEESIPGPLPYKDAEGNPLFTFAHAGYDSVGGRILASSPLDVIIQKQDQLNQLDSNIQLTVSRMSNPVWLEPKGMEIERLTGMPGLVIKYNWQIGGGNAKPERLEGVGPHPSLFQLREQYLKDIEELAGTFDIIKGQKPTGIEAFSALQLLVERSQSRFAGVFTSRGDAYKQWYSFAIELEREFGPDERTKFTLEPGRTWTYQTFKRAQLKGSVGVVVEDGSNIPKTSLGFRAAIEHASQLGMLNMQDPDTQYEGLKSFGLTRMVPTLDINVQSALQKQHAFEQWVANEKAQQMSMQQTEQATTEYEQTLAATPPSPDGSVPPPPSMLKFTPLDFKPWYDPTVHRQEFVKWANSDKIRELLKEKPQLEPLLVQHLADIDAAGAQQVMRQQAAAQGRVGGAAEGMNNSNRESTSGNEPSGSGEGAQRQGPA